MGHAQNEVGWCAQVTILHVKENLYLKSDPHMQIILS